MKNRYGFYYKLGYCVRGWLKSLGGGGGGVGELGGNLPPVDETLGEVQHHIYMHTTGLS